MDELKRPKPEMVGTGMASYAGKLAELDRQYKAAILAGDYDKADEIERKKQALIQSYQRPEEK